MMFRNLRLAPLVAVAGFAMTLPVVSQALAAEKWEFGPDAWLSVGAGLRASYAYDAMLRRRGQATSRSTAPVSIVNGQATQDHRLHVQHRDRPRQQRRRRPPAHARRARPLGVQRHLQHLRRPHACRRAIAPTSTVRTISAPGNIRSPAPIPGDLRRPRQRCGGLGLRRGQAALLRGRRLRGLHRRGQLLRQSQTPTARSSPAA